MANNKVILGDEVLIDLTEDTVTPDNLLAGVKAHNAAGEEIEGAVITHNVIDNLESDSAEDALSAHQGKELNRLKLATDLDNIGEAGIEKIKEIGGEHIDKTQAEYDALSDAEKNDPNKYYFITDGEPGLADNSIVSDAWTSRTYNVGEYCISDNILWKCLVQNSERPSEGANWKRTNVTNELNAPISSEPVMLWSGTLTGNSTATLLQSINNFSKLIFAICYNTDSTTLSYAEVDTRIAANTTRYIALGGVSYKSNSTLTFSAAISFPNTTTVQRLGSYSASGAVLAIYGI